MPIVGSNVFVNSRPWRFSVISCEFVVPFGRRISATRTTKSSPPSEGRVAAASADGVVLSMSMEIFNASTNHAKHHETTFP